MKKLIQSTFILSCFLVIGMVSYSQEKSKLIYIRAVPEWVPAKGYWVVESNKKTPKQSIIYFYNDESILVYKEKVEGVRLKANKEKVKFHLKKVLETALTAWEQQQKPTEDDGWVVAELRK